MNTQTHHDLTSITPCWWLHTLLVKLDTDQRIMSRLSAWVCVLCVYCAGVCQHEFRDGSESLRNPKLSAASSLYNTRAHTHTHTHTNLHTKAPKHVLPRLQLQPTLSEEQTGIESDNGLVGFRLGWKWREWCQGQTDGTILGPAIHCGTFEWLSGLKKGFKSFNGVITFSM